MVPLSRTKISSASTTVDRRWAITIVVRLCVARFSASRIFWKKNVYKTLTLWKTDLQWNVISKFWISLRHSICSSCSYQSNGKRCLMFHKYFAIRGTEQRPVGKLFHTMVKWQRSVSRCVRVEQREHWLHVASLLAGHGAAPWNLHDYYYTFIRFGVVISIDG